MSISTVCAKALDILLPASCLLCGGTAHGPVLCAACAADLPRLPSPRCPRCALPTAAGETCGRCLRRPPHFDATAATYLYAAPMDTLIQALKYRRRLASAEFLATCFEVPPDTHLPDLLMPVPLAAARLAERGYNQAVELARPLARKLDRPLELHAVVRSRDTPAQATLTWRQRRRNLRQAFDCRRDLSGLTIWVIDDVMTTGATLDELARTLKLAGARRVENLVVARAVRTLSPAPALL